MLALFLVAAVACSDSGEVGSILDEADEVMETHPDSAMKIIDSIDPSLLRSDQLRARYALLKSMALDKNYIDTTDLKVLQPAIDYYLKNGTPDEKLRTYYYQGRIYQNKNERDSAMRSFMKGIDIADNCKDSLTIARTLVAQGIIYKDFYDHEGFADNYLKAANILKNRNRIDQEFECLFNALNGMLLSKNKEKADSIIGLLDNLKLSDDQQKMMSGVKLSYILQFGSNEDLRTFLASPGENKSYTINGMLDLARAYHRIGDNHTALQLIRYVEQRPIEDDTLKYLSIKYKVLEDTKDFENALTTFRDFIYRIEAQNSSKIEQKSRSIEEKHNMELRAQEEKRKHLNIIWSAIAGCLVLVMGVIILILLLRSSRIKKNLATEKVRTTQLENDKLKSERDRKVLEAENLAHRVEELEAESSKLKDILDSQEIPSEIRGTILKRIDMLNTLLASYISSSGEYEKPYENYLKDLTKNTEEFMNSNREAFQASYPAFFKYLEQHELSVREINYVCLYALGLRGKDIGIYMKMPSHVNISSVIRKKFGLNKHETNLGNYIRNLLKSQ